MFVKSWFCVFFIFAVAIATVVGNFVKMEPAEEKSRTVLKTGDSWCHEKRCGGEQENYPNPPSACPSSRCLPRQVDEKYYECKQGSPQVLLKTTDGEHVCLGTDAMLKPHIEM